jgi:hypothetical protein
MALKPCLVCGRVTTGSKCPQCRRASPYQRTEWRQLSAFVVKRDGSCRQCGSTHFLAAHHVLPALGRRRRPPGEPCRALRKLSRSPRGGSPRIVPSVFRVMACSSVSRRRRVATPASVRRSGAPPAASSSSARMRFPGARSRYRRHRSPPVQRSPALGPPEAPAWDEYRAFFLSGGA